MREPRRTDSNVNAVSFSSGSGTRTCARAAAEPDRIALVDATQSVDEVGARILEQLKVRAWIS